LIFFLEYTNAKKPLDYCNENGPPALQHPAVHYENRVNDLAVRQETRSLIDPHASSGGASNSMRGIDLNQFPPNEDEDIDMNQIL